jgi:hypothetical protein
VALEPLTLLSTVFGSDSKNIWYNIDLTLKYVFILEIQTLVLTANASSAIANTVA